MDKINPLPVKKVIKALEKIDFQQISAYPIRKFKTTELKPQRGADIFKHISVFSVPPWQILSKATETQRRRELFSKYFSASL
jgi:hypothetical protein